MIVCLVCETFLYKVKTVTSFSDSLQLRQFKLKSSPCGCSFIKVPTILMILYVSKLHHIFSGVWRKYLMILFLIAPSGRVSRFCFYKFIRLLISKVASMRRILNCGNFRQLSQSSQVFQTLSYQQVKRGVRFQKQIWHKVIGMLDKQHILSPKLHYILQQEQVKRQMAKSSMQICSSSWNR